MQVNFIAQPNEQLGNLLATALNPLSNPTRVVIVSAFASLQTVLRFKKGLLALHANSTAIRIVLGVDMGGTSKEVLTELESWPVEVFVFKNRRSRVTFHPKLYVVETAINAEVFLGSNNLTDGGLFGNYEGAVRVTYQLPADAASFTTAKDQPSKFIEPAPPIGRRLDAAYLARLVARKDIPSDSEARQRRKGVQVGTNKSEALDDFGYETTAHIPPVPPEVQRVISDAVRKQFEGLEAARRETRAAARRAAKTTVTGKGKKAKVLVLPKDNTVQLDFKPIAQIAPRAFYLELTATGGATGKIPGEQRIPLEALNIAQEFWGWRDNYIRSANPRKGAEAAGEERVYWNWKPVWRIHDVSDATRDITQEVRMYLYENSSDYRFYSGKLVGWAEAGDMVRITRCDGLPYEYECELAKAGTPEHARWKALCSLGAHSPRVFGFS